VNELVGATEPTQSRGISNPHHQQESL
jgi:hypothetical protein